jgi:hypothetical protein
MASPYCQLSEHLATGMKIRIERNRPADPLLNGYLMQLSDRLGLMHCFDDFEPDGYSIFRLSDVVSVRSGNYERHWDRMLRGEELLGGLDRELEVDLNTIRAAIESVSRQFKLMTVQCEDAEEDVQDFYIGQVVSFEGTELIFDAFDALGQWNDESSRVLLDEITMVQFETPYIRHFSKYLTGSPTGSV